MTWIIGLFILFCLGSTFFLTATFSALQTATHLTSQEQLNMQTRSFFYTSFTESINPNIQNLDFLFLSLISAQNTVRFLFLATSLIYFPTTIWNLIFLLAVFIYLGDLLPRRLGATNPKKYLQMTPRLISILLIFVLPITLIYIKLLPNFSIASFYSKETGQPSHLKEKIVEMIQSRADSTSLDIEDQRLIESIITFGGRRVKEIMTPRINIYSISADTPLITAANALIKEGFSRIPVYEKDLDKIIGVLMHKDILAIYLESSNTEKFQQYLKQPVCEFIKSTLYTPETRKISHLLKEFREKQQHLAIVVNEYGGTEGLVTIEDILEDIVGEIEDEYDEEELLFKPDGKGGWIVDGKMSILDIETNLEIQIPREEDYDTLAGYIIYNAGTIPQSGFQIDRDDFQIEILKSNDRSVDKARLTPRSLT